MGPAFDDEGYARMFFTYIKSWNNIGENNLENPIIVSIVMERNSTYSIFIYADPSRKNLTPQFQNIEEKRKLEKFGKRHQQLIMQVIFAHNFEYKPGLQIHKFLNAYFPSDPFFLTPFVVGNNQLKILNGQAIKVNGYKFKRRETLTKNDVEYHFNMEND